MQTNIRAFIAIPLTREVHQQLGLFIQSHGLANRDAGFRPVKPENIHLTLKFLGDVKAASLPAISEHLDRLTVTLKQTSITISGLGAFPGWFKQPRVIWVGVQPVEPIQRMSEQIEKAISALGFPAERKPFSPHLTLARVNQQVAGQRYQEVITRLRNLQPAPVFGDMVADKIILFKSDLQPSGPVYSILSAHRLKG